MWYSHISFFCYSPFLLQLFEIELLTSLSLWTPIWVTFHFSTSCGGILFINILNSEFIKIQVFWRPRYVFEDTQISFPIKSKTSALYCHIFPTFLLLPYWQKIIISPVSEEGNWLQKNQEFSGKTMLDGVSNNHIVFSCSFIYEFIHLDFWIGMDIFSI